MHHRKRILASICVNIIFVLFMFIRVNAQEATPTPDLLTPFAPGTSAVSTQTKGVILQPVEGSFVHGVIDISGSAGYAWNLSFAGAENPDQTWYLLTQSVNPVDRKVLAAWDTTAVPDGAYLLKLSIFSPEGLQVVIQKIMIDNSGLLITGTPTPAPSEISPHPSRESSAALYSQTITPTLAVVVGSTSTNMPDGPQNTRIIGTANIPEDNSQQPINPAVIRPVEILFVLGKSFLIVSIVFGLAGLLTFIRSKLPK